jgi:hypothetical protein
MNLRRPRWLDKIQLLKKESDLGFKNGLVERRIKNQAALRKCQQPGLNTEFGAVLPVSCWQCFPSLSLHVLVVVNNMAWVISDQRCRDKSSTSNNKRTVL